MKEIIRGDSYAKKRPLFRLQLRDIQGVPVDLSGHVVRATFRSEIVPPDEDPQDSNASWTGTLIVSPQGIPTQESGVVLIGNPSEGSIELHITSDMSRRLPVGVVLCGDVELTDPEGEKFTYFLEEKVIAKDGVTHRTEG